MKLFDLHCDTITECCVQNKKLARNDLHISLERAACYDKWIQVFAVWMPDDYRGADAVRYFNRVYDCYLRQMQENSADITKCEHAADLENCEHFGAILSVEGASVLAGSLEMLEKIYTMGVRLMTLTWNGSNEVGNGSRSGKQEGLTSFGRQVVQKMNELNMLIDVSHLNEQGFYDVAALSEKPFVASHSDSSEIWHHPRNLTDDQIRVLCGKKGLLGINFYKTFLGENNCGYDGAYRHIAHMLDCGAQDILAIGADFDGCVTDDVFAGVEKMYDFYGYLLSRGLKQETIDKIFYENAYAFFLQWIS